MGLIYTQTDTQFADGPDGMPTWNEGVLLTTIKGVFRHYGSGYQPNAEGYDPTEPPSGGVHWPNIASLTAAVGGTAGTFDWNMTMETGPYTAGAYSWWLPLAPGYTIPAGTWTCRFRNPPQSNSGLTWAAIGINYWSDVGGTWTREASLGNFTVGQALGQASPETYSHDCTGAPAVTRNPSADQDGIGINYIITNANGVATVVNLKSSVNFDTPILGPAGGLIERRIPRGIMRGVMRGVA